MSPKQMARLFGGREKAKKEFFCSVCVTLFPNLKIQQHVLSVSINHPDRKKIYKTWFLNVCFMELQVQNVHKLGCALICPNKSAY